MSALRKLRRQRLKRQIEPLREAARELGPMSAVLLDFTSQVVDIATLDDIQLQLVLTLATAAWNNAFEPDGVSDLQSRLHDEFGAQAADLVEMLGHMVEVRRELFAHDRRVVVSTGIDYPNGKRRVLAACAMGAPRSAIGQTA